MEKTLKTYKIEKIYKILVIALLLSSIFYGFSHFTIQGSGIKFFVLIFLSLFVLFSALGLILKTVKIEGNILTYKGLIGCKKVDLSDLQDTSVIKMKGRILCIISDTKNYAFITSMFENFQDIIKQIIEIAPGDSTEKLKSIDFNEVKRKSNFMKFFLIAATLFLIIFGIYNLL